LGYCKLGELFGIGANPRFVPRKENAMKQKIVVFASIVGFISAVCTIITFVDNYLV